LKLEACGLPLTSGLAFLPPAQKSLSFDEEGLSKQTHASKTLDQQRQTVCVLAAAAR